MVYAAEGKIDASDAKKNQDLNAGGVKFDLGKIPLDLLPMEALLEVGKVLDFGARKYDSHNWRKGMFVSRLIAAALRHIFSFTTGETLDKETGLNHLAHALCCLMFALTFMLDPAQAAKWDDRYKKAE